MLVNNAGLGADGAAEEISVAQAQRVYDVNVFGPLRMTKAVLLHMRAQRHGREAQAALSRRLDRLAGAGRARQPAARPEGPHPRRRRRRRRRHHRHPTGEASAGVIRPVVARVFDFESTREAFARVEQGHTKVGKVVIRMK